MPGANAASKCIGRRIYVTTYKDFDAVLFDWDGTLVDSLQFIFNAHSHVHTQMAGRPWTREEFEANVHFSSRELYPRVYGEEGAQKAYGILDRYLEENHLKEITRIRGTIALLDRLYRVGMPMGVVSNKRPLFLEKEVKAFGCAKYFTDASNQLILVGAGQAVKDKPSGEPILMALSMMGLKPGKRILFVGDSKSDVAAAVDAGCTPALFFRDQPDHPLIEDYKLRIYAKGPSGFSKVLGL